MGFPWNWFTPPPPPPSVCNCLCWPLGPTNQPCQPNSSSSSWYLLRRSEFVLSKLTTSKKGAGPNLHLCTLLFVCIHLKEYNFKIMFAVQDSWAILISSLHFLKFWPFILQAFSLPCPAPNSACAISEAAACSSGELANSTICASCQVQTFHIYTSLESSTNNRSDSSTISYVHLKPKTTGVKVPAFHIHT